MLPFGGMVGKPVAGWLADFLGQQRIVFLLALLLSGFSLHTIFLLVFVNFTLVFLQAFSTSVSNWCLPSMEISQQSLNVLNRGQY